MTGHAHRGEANDMTISDNTKIKAGVVIAAIAACCTLAVTLFGLRSDVDEIKANRWTLAQQCEHALRTAIFNPGMKVPDPRSPGQSILVGEAKVVPVKTGEH